MLWYSAVIVLGLLALVWSADRFVEGASAIARRVGLSPWVIGLTIVSFGTSAPEILISVMSAVAGSGELAVGNALGSNIANIGLVLGTTLIIGSIVLNKETVFIDLPILIATVLLTWVLLSDLVLSPANSLVLLCALGLFFARILHHARTSAQDLGKDVPAQLSAIAEWSYFVGGLLLLIAASRALVWAASHIAATMGVSELVIGLTIVAVGTSLPELAASVASAFKGHADMAVGAIVGSNMLNILLVLAIPGLWGSILLQSEVITRDMGTVFVTTLALALAALGRWNGVSQTCSLKWGTGMLLLTLYAVYYVWLFATP
ncbi:calcium/sodium antiporter [Luminiphilus sp.]|nr:calcium/sodium antiporter [Luminiphilus sp.]MDA9710834.1 calcium/sodium antiporter [Luminiphilus sp.]